MSKEKFLSLYRSARVAQSTDALPDQPAMKRRKTEDGSKGVPTKVATPAPATAPGTPASPLAPAQTQTVFGQPAPTQSAFGQRAFAALASATGTQALSAPQTPVQPPQQQPKPFWQLPTPQPSLDTHAAQGQKRARSSLDDEQRAQYEQQAVLALTALGYKVDVPDFPKLLPPDVYEDELQVMAEIRAYFRVAYKVCPSRAARTLCAALTVFCSASSTTSRWRSTTSSWRRSADACRTFSSRSWASAGRTRRRAVRRTLRRTRSSSRSGTS